MADGRDGLNPAAPWFAPYRRDLERIGDARGAALLDALNAIARERAVATAGGATLRFVDATDCGDDGLAYEARIARSAAVATRLEGGGALHDFFNALVWLAFPRLKARLNALQAAAIAADGVGARRGALRDAVTLFDESGAAWVGADAVLADDLRAHAWQRLFVERRERVARAVRVRVVGHALLEKLARAPYKAITAFAWCLPPAPGGNEAAGAVDAALAEALAARPLRRESLAPLPLLGLPGWWPANEDPAFYNDADVFRRPRATRAG